MTGQLEPHEKPVAQHTVSPAQVQAIIAAGMTSIGPLHIAPIEEKPRPGPMKAVKVASGKIEFCAYVYNGARNIMGTINRILVTGTFASPSSETIDRFIIPTSDGHGGSMHARCESLGIGVL